MDEQPQRRATDLPENAPWWAKWIEANLHAAWACIYGMAGVAAEAYAMYPDQINAALKQYIPPTLWPHIVALAAVFFAFQRARKQGNKP